MVDMKTVMRHECEKRQQAYTAFMPRELVSDSLLSYLTNIGYFTAPSSNGRHGAWVGGNFDHSLAVTRYMLEHGGDWGRECSPYIVGMFHDLCKSETRSFDHHGRIIKLPRQSYLHSERSLEMCASAGLNLIVEEKLCIYYHMGDHDENYDYSILMKRMARKYPNILLTQQADTAMSQKGI